MPSPTASAQQPAPVRLWPVLKVVATIIVGFMLASGFDWTTPAKKFAKQDARIDAVESVAASTAADVGAIRRLQCLDDRWTARDRALVQLDCADVDKRRRESMAADHTAAAPAQAGRERR